MEEKKIRIAEREKKKEKGFFRKTRLRQQKQNNQGSVPPYLWAQPK